MLTCNLCALSTKNHFIFKRHRQRCTRLHKGQAVAHRVEAAVVHKGKSSEWEDIKEDNIIDTAVDGKDVDARASPEDSDKSELGNDAEAAGPEKISTRLRSRSVAEVEPSDQTQEDKSPETEVSSSRPDSSLRQILEEEGKCLEVRDVSVKPSSSCSSQNIQRVPPPVSRNYSCDTCTFTTTHSRDFLYHKIQMHNARHSVFSCVVCEYCSAFKHKIQRHMAQIHDIMLKINEIFPEGDPKGPTTTGVQLTVPSGNELSRKPSKLQLKSSSKAQKVVSSKVIRKSKQSNSKLDSLLLKLRSKNASDAKLSTFIISAGDSSSSVETASGSLFKCKLCLFTGSNKNKVMRHLHACHLNVKPFKCSLCSFQTVSKMEFYAHKKKHTSTSNTIVFKCKECDYATEFRPNFDRHMLRHGCNKPVKCSLCSYATDHEGALKRHVTSHHANTAENQSLLMSGDELQANREKNNAEVEEEEDSVEDGLESEKHRCPVCDSMYTRSADLNRHMKNKHNVCRKDYSRQHGVPDSDREDEDDDDDEEVMDLEEFTADMDAEEMSVSDEEGNGQDLDKDDPSLDWESPQSDNSFVNKRINKKCSHCSYIAKWASDLRRHMKVHSMVKRFKCSLCCKKYKYLGDLNVHMRRDHEVSPEDSNIAPEKVSTFARKKSSPRMFRCPACHFSTKIKVDMDHHSQQHTEEKTYSCKLCDYQTYWRGDMGRHLYRRHPADVKNDADVKNFFIYRPERRAISKGGRGVLELTDNNEKRPESDDASEEAVAPVENEELDEEEMAVVDSRERIKFPIEDLPSESVTEAINNGAEVGVDKEGNRIYRCPVCPYAHAQLHKVKNHMDIHLNLKQYLCPVCGQRGNWKYDVSKHMQSKHPENSLKVLTLTPEEAKTTIQEYLATHPSIKRDYTMSLSTTPTKGAAAVGISASPTKTSQPSSEDKKPELKSILDVLGKGPGTLPPKQKGKKPQPQPAAGRKVRAFEYKCSHCQFRSTQRFTVSKHQRQEHNGQPGLGILAKTVLVNREDLNKDNQDLKKNETQKPDADGPVRVTRSGTENTCQPASKVNSTEEAECEDEDTVDNTDMLYRCAQCGKQGSSKGSIKKHYNYIHPNSEVRIVSVSDGVEFNYYTGLPTSDSVPCPPVCDSTPSPAVPSKAFASEDLTSKLNDPRKHGYVKPFQCSVCGQRSNWKWDIKKHLRIKHPDEFGYVIVLQLEDARASCDKYTRPKGEYKDSQYKDSPSLDGSTVDVSTVSEKEDSSGNESSSMSPAKALVGSGMPYKSQEMLLGRYRRYKCSVCGYRSNWRTDICRHIERRHTTDAGAKVIFMGVEEARETFMEYHYNPPNPSPHTPGLSAAALSSPAKQSLAGPAGPSTSPFKVPSPVKPLSAVKKPGQTGKAWRCPKCPFVSALKSHIVAHMQNHGMKPFLCSACGTTSRFRSPLYRHIRKQHNSTNYNVFAKIVIKFNKVSPASKQKGVGATLKVVEAFLCRLCTGNPVETETRGQMMDHLLSQHASTDSSQALKIKKRLGGDESELGRSKCFLCLMCPYRTEKRSMLTFHHLYHQPSPQNKYKCKLCPYYVCAPRLLHQHMKVHSDFCEDDDDEEDDFERTNQQFRRGEKTPPSSPSKRSRSGSSGEGTPKRHVCTKCPYSTNSKNDFLYHKQFHRSRPAADFKCEHCDYWVTHKRLLKQHMKLHGVDCDDDSSLCDSPTKSLASDASAVLDAVEIAAIKQKMISNKITASLSATPSYSPMKMATGVVGPAGNRPGFMQHNGSYKKLHQCPKCPYTNIRLRNLRLHQQMHGIRKANYPLMKCPHCDYYVGARGLLSHHMKVHQRRYRYDSTDSTFDMEKQEDIPGKSKILSEPDDGNKSLLSCEIPQRHKVDTLLEISRFKKYSCEKCPYASGKRSHFVRHLELHGSRQRHACLYCDYSVSSISLLQQHQKIHLMPNQNLLATQSFANLQHLREVPADVALASALPPADSAEPVTISVIHDHLELYENDDSNSLSAGPRKLYRCDRCPYANVRRDHLLTHMRFHLTTSSFHCPYCDYSAPKQQLLTQHLRVHFCPLPELSDWLIENGQSERAQEVNDRVEVDLNQAVQVAEKLQSCKLKRRLDADQLAQLSAHGLKEDEVAAKKPRENGVPDIRIEANDKGDASPAPKTAATGDVADKPGSSDIHSGENTDDNIYICQYCDREFPTSKLLIAHELLHLIGNHYEFIDGTATDNSSATDSRSSPQKATQAQKNPQHVEGDVYSENSQKDQAKGDENDVQVDKVTDAVEGAESKGHNAEGASLEVKELKSQGNCASSASLSATQSDGKDDKPRLDSCKGAGLEATEKDCKDKKEPIEGQMEQNLVESLEVCGEERSDKDDNKRKMRKLRSGRGMAAAE